MSPVDFFTKLCGHYDYIYILESVEGPEKLAEYSFIGFDPRLVVTVKNGRAEIYDRNSEERTVAKVDDPLHLVKRLVSGLSISYEGYRFIGGAVGYISYDAVRYWEKMPEVSVGDLNLPDLEMGIFDKGIIFDHKRGENFYYYIGENSLPKYLI